MYSTLSPRASLVKHLAETITAGGATLRDFANSAGDRGHFTPRLQIYDRAGLPCPPKKSRHRGRGRWLQLWKRRLQGPE